jgi:hypothetical protein
MYFDINLSIEDDIRRVEKISAHTSKGGLIIAADSNTRSKMWFDITTNQRGKLIEKFMITNNLFLINEDKGIPNGTIYIYIYILKTYEIYSYMLKAKQTM